MSPGYFALILVALMLSLALLVGLGRLVGKFSSGVRQGLAESRKDQTLDK